MNEHDLRRQRRLPGGPKLARQWGWAVVAFSLFCWAKPAAAQEVPADIQAALVLKLLGYDRKLTERSPNGVMMVAVIGAGDEGAGAKFKALSGRKIQGKQVKVEMLSDNGTQPVKATLTSLGANVVYLGSKVEAGKAKDAIAWANQNQVPTFAGNRALAEKGAAIGFTVEKGKPRFVVNVAASRAQRIELPARVLRLAELIK